MSDRTWQERFSDIIEAADRIKQYIEDMSEDDFYTDSKTFDAVVRNVILIGDAATGIDDSIREQMPDIPWRRIVGMRNILTHTYFDTEPPLVWRVANQRLSPLASRLQSYLTSPQSP